MTQSNPTTIREPVLDQLHRYHESTARELYARVKDHPLVSDQRAITNALDQLRATGLATHRLDAQTGVRYWGLVAAGGSETLPKPTPANASEESLPVAGIHASTQESSPAANKPASPAPADAAGPGKRPRTKPYTPNRIAGAYVHRGNLVIKLDRRTNAKSITLQAGDFAMLEGMYCGVLSQS